VLATKIYAITLPLRSLEGGEMGLVGVGDSFHLPLQTYFFRKIQIGNEKLLQSVLWVLIRIGS